MRLLRAALVGAGLVAAAGCVNRPSDAELDALRAEAVAANETARLEAEASEPKAEASWTLGISGQTTSPPVAPLSWKEIDQLAIAHIRTTNPQETERRGEIQDFRGVLISELLRRHPVEPGVTEITFVAFDAFRSTIRVADALSWEIALAVELDGKPIQRSDGGPLFLVFPHTETPASAIRYPDRFWSFYVTHMVIGTEPIALRVGGVTLDQAALSKLPPAELHMPVKFKVFWPDTEVALYGVLLKDVLAVAGARLAGSSGVVALGKAPIQRDPADPIKFSVADVDACGIVLVTHWGPNRAAIPARMGGPLAIAVPDACGERYGDKAWVTFLEELVIAP